MFLINKKFSHIKIAFFNLTPFCSKQNLTKN